MSGRGFAILNKIEKIRLAKSHMASLIDCNADIFDREENVFVEKKNFPFWSCTFGGNVVILADAEMIAWCREEFAMMQPEDIMSNDTMFSVDEMLRKRRYKLANDVRYLHLYPDHAAPKPVGFEYRLFKGSETAQFGHIEHFNSNPNDSTMVYAAYDGSKLAAVAGAVDDSGTLWSIFRVDTMSQYRGRGLGGYLAKQLTLEVEKMDVLPYYTTWAGNLPSTRLALNIGYQPVWMGYHAIESDL